MGSILMKPRPKKQKRITNNHWITCIGHVTCIYLSGRNQPTSPQAIPGQYSYPVRAAVTEIYILVPKWAKIFRSKIETENVVFSKQRHQLYRQFTRRSSAACLLARRLSSNSLSQRFILQCVVWRQRGLNLTVGEGVNRKCFISSFILSQLQGRDGAGSLSASSPLAPVCALEAHRARTSYLF
jgi:hypothetical protein